MILDAAEALDSNDSVCTENTPLTLEASNTTKGRHDALSYIESRADMSGLATMQETEPYINASSSMKATRIRLVQDAQVDHLSTVALAPSSHPGQATLVRLLVRLLVGAAIGALVGLGVAFAVILFSRLLPHGDTTTMMTLLLPSSHRCQEHTCVLRPWHSAFRGTLSKSGLNVYLDLFGGRETFRDESEITITPTQMKAIDPRKRMLADSSTSTQRYSSRNNGPKLVIAGQMAVEEGPCNIAQLNLDTDVWSLSERIQLSLYNSYSGGEVYHLLANHTPFRPDESTVPKDRLYYGSGELIVVGAFDTTYRNSQVTYCSVGKWDGDVLSKVGEGLCNSALSKGMKITTAALAGPQDVYVAGSFHTQVWNGDQFVKIFNIAHFNAVEQVWLPLNVGQITCSWCTVTVLALAWDSKRRQLHVAGKFNAIDGRNVPAGLAIYDCDSGHLVAHPGGGLSMRNVTQDGVATALQFDEEAGVLYVMGSFERLTQTREVCLGLAAFEINANRWTCLADAAHTVLPTGGGNMLLSPFGLLVAGKTTSFTTWPDSAKPYTIALLKATLKKRVHIGDMDSSTDPIVDFNWSWLPGFGGHDEPLHALANGFGEYEGTVFIAGDNLVAKWSYEKSTEDADDQKVSFGRSTATASSQSIEPVYVPITVNLSTGRVRGAIMAISQMMPEPDEVPIPEYSGTINYTIIVYCVALGTIIGIFMALIFNRNVSSTIASIFDKDAQFKGFSLDTLTYSAIEHTSITEAYHRAMQTRYVQHPHLLTLIDPQEIFLQRIIGEGTFGRVWSAKWRSSKVAVKEFVFAQAAVAGRSSMQGEIIEEIIGEAGMMAILRHPNVLQLFGCSLTAQAIWIVSELCSLGSLRQLLDDNEKSLPLALRINLALQVAEGMTYLHNQEPPIIHRDLKSHNIFIHETFTESDVSSAQIDLLQSSKEQNNGTVARGQSEQDHKMQTQSTIVAKIGDWGSARATLSGSRTMTHGVGTACWLAPEVIKHARSSKYSDVYSYGIVLWELATREEVYQGLETTQIIAKVANESLRPPVPLDCPWKDVMVKCWEESPSNRLEFSEIVEKLNETIKTIPSDKMVGKVQAKE